MDPDVASGGGSVPVSPFASVSTMTLSAPGSAVGSLASAPIGHGGPASVLPTPEQAEECFFKEFRLADFEDAAQYLNDHHHLDLRGYWSSVKSKYPEGITQNCVFKQVPLTALMTLDAVVGRLEDVKLSTNVANFMEVHLHLTYPPDSPLLDFGGWTYGELWTFTRNQENAQWCVNEIKPCMATD